MNENEGSDEWNGKGGDERNERKWQMEWKGK
jgi:hypothetical protein